MTTYLLKTVRVLGAAALALLLAFPATAQDVEKKDVNRIEIKDGKVYVNGEMVKELDDANLRVFFSKDGENHLGFFHADGDHEFGEFGEFAFRAPRINRFFDGDRIVGWMDNDFEFPDANIDPNFEFEPLYNRLEVLRGDDEHPFMAGAFGNSEIRKLERRSRELARQFHRAEGTGKDELGEELQEVVNQIFDLKLEEQRERIEKLSGDLDKLRSHMEERRSNRAQIIERRIKELKGERDALDW